MTRATEADVELARAWFRERGFAAKCPGQLCECASCSRWVATLAELLAAVREEELEESLAAYNATVRNGIHEQ